MSQFLAFISFSGVLQGYALATIFYFNRKGPHLWLAALFAIFSSIMLAIIITNNMGGESAILELVEFGGTLLIGPLIYLLSLKLASISFPSKRTLFLHFLPFFAYTFFQLLPHTRFVQIPIILLLLHFQLYTAWLIFTIFSAEGGKQKAEHPVVWLKTIAAILVLIHAAQWLRFFLSNVPGLKLLVPGVAFVAFYLFTLFGLSKSRLFDFTGKGKNAWVGEEKTALLKKKLEYLLTDKKIHTNPRLTVETLAAEMGVMPYVLSQLINHTFDSNFNDYINFYRVETAKELLSNPDQKHITIEAIGRKAGFNSRSSFYAAFRKKTGKTPSDYLSGK